MAVFFGGAVNASAAGGVFLENTVIPCEGRLFLPESLASRGTVAIALYNIADGGTAGAGAYSGFSDVPAGSLYYAPVSFCASKGYIDGYPDGTFRPEGFITRAEICVILSRALSLSVGGYVSLPSDVPPGHWASDSISAVIGGGIMSGYSDKTFRPEKNLTRAELATIAVKAAKLKQPAYIREFSDVPRSHWAYKSIACVSIPPVPEPLAYETEVAALVNAARSNAGVGSLTLDPLLCEVARAKARDMIDNDYFYHTSPTWGDPIEMLEAFGFPNCYPGEIIARWYRTPSEVVPKWIESPSHYKNIIEKGFTKTGVGYALHKDGIGYWVQIFTS